MTAHAFNVDFPIEACIEFFVAGGKVPNSFLGVKSERGLKQVLTIGPEMTVGVLTAANDVGDFFSSIVYGVFAIQAKFLDVHGTVLPIGVIKQVEFFVVHRFYPNKVGFGIGFFCFVEAHAHARFDECGVFIGMTALAGLYAYIGG